MFSYHLESQDIVSRNARGEPVFNPPVKEQLHAAVCNILQNRRWSANVKKIIEFGCAEMRLFRLMRHIETVEHIVEVDTNEACLEINKHRAFPLIADHLKTRPCPLRVEIFCGSITDSVENLRNFDVVVALEVIQQLMPDELEKVPQNIFGFIQPKLVIISTPNRDFNVLFNAQLNENGFRNNTHKFEWTRKEFRKWANNICQIYPNYSVAYVGVGSPPPTNKKIGHVTQIAIFARNDLINRPLTSAILTELPADLRPEVQYKTIYEVDFPFRKDERSTMQKIKDEAENYVNRCQNNERFFNRERCIYQIPIICLIEYAKTIEAKEEDVLSALRELEFPVENEYIVLTEEYVDENYRRSYDYGGAYEDIEYPEDYDYDEEQDDNETNDVEAQNDNETENTSNDVEDDDEPEESWD